MNTRQFKTRNGSELSFTTMGLGMGPIGEIYEVLDEKTAIATVEQAYRSGIRLFDTSPHYGNGIAEARLGAGLRAVPRGKRFTIFLFDFKANFFAFIQII